MRRLLLFSTLMLSTGAGAGFWLADGPIQSFQPASADNAVTLLPPDTISAATELSFQAECVDGNPRVPLVGLTWRSTAARGAAQRVDITKFREGFSIGRFDVTAELASDERAIGFDAGEPGINYYWRVLTETPGGWTQSSVSRFEVPVCPLDMPEHGQER